MVKGIGWRGYSARGACLITSCRSVLRVGGPRRRGCGDCVETERVKKEGLGPRSYIWRVTWKAVHDAEFNRLAEEARRERGRPEPEPAPEVSTCAGSDMVEMERRKAPEVCL